MKTTDYSPVVKKFDTILSRGLSKGLGDSNGVMCIEAALCSALGLPHGDNPGCVSQSVRAYKIVLNDCNWSSPYSRASGMRDLGIAQLGSIEIEGAEFSRRLAKETISILIPALFREIFPYNNACLAAATFCENEGTVQAARAAEAAAVGPTDKYLLLSASLALQILKDLGSPGCKYL